MDDATAADNCGEVTIEVSSETTAGDAAGNYVIVRTLRTTMLAAARHADHHGPRHHGPEFTFVPEGFEVTCSSEPVEYDMATASDNCGEVTVTLTFEEIPDVEGPYTLN